MLLTIVLQAEVVQQLMVLLRNNPDEAVRSISAVLLRRMLTRCQASLLASTEQLL